MVKIVSDGVNMCSVVLTRQPAQHPLLLLTTKFKFKWFSL